jgi:hypothetical protein
MSGDALVLPALRVEALSAPRASSDEELVASWLASLKSAHSRRNFAMTAQCFRGDFYFTASTTKAS